MALASWVMASIFLHNVFTRALDTLAQARSLKGLFSHGGLYLSILIYTAIGAKVFQVSHPNCYIYCKTGDRTGQMSNKVQVRYEVLIPGL